MLAMLSLSQACLDDLEELVDLRIEAMRESLERIGRFDPERARQRLVAGFAPELTRHVLMDGRRVGFVTVKPDPDGLLLDHLYVRPAYQGSGVGAAVLAVVFGEADAAGLQVRVGALRGSASNRFYLRHGFVHVEESEWDTYYVRPALTR
jgi:GNAT superfamily N-acetyltransferase